MILAAILTAAITSLWLEGPWRKPIVRWLAFRSEFLSMGAACSVCTSFWFSMPWAFYIEPWWAFVGAWLGGRLLLSLVRWAEYLTPDLTD